MAEAKFKRPELTDRDLIDFYFKSTQAEAATVLLQMYICGQGFTK